MDKNLEEAQRCLAIKDVILRESNIDVRDDIDLPNMDLDSVSTQSYKRNGNIEVLEGAAPQESVDEDAKPFWIYKFRYQTGIRVVPKEEIESAISDEYLPAVQIMATFESRYTSEMELSVEMLQAFSKDNVGFNIWPYWREYVQSTCCRLGMTETLSVPLYRILKGNKQEVLELVKEC